MSVIVPFRGRAELAAERNLADFLSAAEEATPFSNVVWTSNGWNLTDHLPMRSRGKRQSWIHFSSWRDSAGSSSIKSDFLREPFLLFARAAISEVFRRTRDSSLIRWLFALRAIEHALVEEGRRCCVTGLTATTMDRAADLVRSRYPGSAWGVGRCLQRLIVDVIRPAQLLSTPFDWKSPFPWKAPVRSDAIYNDKRAAERVADIRAVIALGAIHETSRAEEDSVVTSFVALALHAPSRASEILSLPVDCESTSQGASSERKGIAWRPAKGGMPITKFAASDESEALASDAIARLIVIGEPARKAAKWYRDNPSSLYLPAKFEHLRGADLTLDEITAILGLERRPRGCDAISKMGLTSTGKRTVDKSRFSGRPSASWGGLYTFSSVEQWALNQLPAGFPVLDPITGLEWHEGLFVLPKHILAPHFATARHVPTPVSISMINHALGSMPNGRTIFSRHNKLDPDGVPWKIRSHQFRHLLDTLAQSKHLSQELIAFWAGRASVSQNDWYNHVPQHVAIEAFQLLKAGSTNISVHGALSDKASHAESLNLMTYDDAVRLEVGALLTTIYGLCRHDFALTPCPKHKDCISCGENLFQKGDARQLSQAIAQRDVLRNAAKSCQLAIERGEAGAQQWQDRNRERLQRWELAVELMQSDSVPDGALFSLPPPLHSQTRSDLMMDASLLPLPQLS